MKFRLPLFAVLTALASCTAQPTKPVGNEIFDEQSASTLLVVASPMVFARERSDVAAHARDYATLVAVEIDNSGEYSQYLMLYRWSTVDKRMLPPIDLEAGQLRIVADGRVIDLKPMRALPVSFERRRELHVPNHGDVVPRAYKIDPATLHYIADSADLSVRLPQEPFDAPFKLYEDGRPALKRFLKQAEAPP
jgi:hypothetical protein